MRPIYRLVIVAMVPHDNTIVCMQCVIYTRLPHTNEALCTMGTCQPYLMDQSILEGNISREIMTCVLYYLRQPKKVKQNAWKV